MQNIVLNLDYHHLNFMCLKSNTHAFIHTWILPFRLHWKKIGRTEEREGAANWLSKDIAPAGFYRSLWQFHWRADKDPWSDHSSLTCALCLQAQCPWRLCCRELNINYQQGKGNCSDTDNMLPCYYLYINAFQYREIIWKNWTCFVEIEKITNVCGD